MPILTCIFFTFDWLTPGIDLDLWNAICEVSPWSSFLFTLQRQKKVCTPGDEAMMKIHQKLFSGIPINFTFFVISPKLKRIWSWNFGFATRKIWAFIWYQKMYVRIKFWTSKISGPNLFYYKFISNCNWFRTTELCQSVYVCTVSCVRG